MTKHPLAVALSRAALLAMFATAPSFAQDTRVGPSPDDQAKNLDKLVVQGEITYRDRAEVTPPVLVYDLEYFQRFEPNTVGDMVKRVPGVGFVGSDVMEYDGAQMRGLGGGYTQVLINGKKVPGAGDDRSFWIDRIPAEMVDRIEILRSNSANRSGDAIAGAINIILRDAYEFDGSYIRIGANRWYDGEINPTFGAVTSFEALGGRLLAGVNVQDRYRAKFKRSDRFEDDSLQDLVSWEDQVEVKDGRDYSGNLSWTADIGENGRFGIDAFYVKTDRDVTEVSYEEEYDDGEVITADVPGLSTVDQENWGVGAEYKFDMLGGRTEFSLDHAGFRDASVESEEAHAYVDGEWDESEAESTAIDADDSETSFKLAHTRSFGNATDMEFGVDWRRKERDITHTSYEWSADDEGDPVVYELDGAVRSLIEEKRLDPYIQFNGTSGALSWEAGLRYETTKADIRYSEDGDVEGAASQDYNVLLPSLHLKWDVSDAARVSLSLARSLKRPNFNELIPALLDGEFGDNDYIGNPLLEAETANGLDLGFEHRLGKRGVVGFNVFYRDVKDLIEATNTGLASVAYLEDIGDDVFDDEDFGFDFIEDFLAANPGSTALQAQAALQAEVEAAGEEWDPDSWLFTSANVGDGKVWGFEFDLSTPLTAFGLDDTGVFMNYSWVKSEIDDFMGTRRFNDQAKSVFNVGFIQDLPSLAASFGVTYRKQGDAYSRVLAEEVIVRYGDELDAFIEKRFGDKFSVRLSANNLLDASKDEFFDKFDNVGDQIDRDYDEYELETEEAGPSYQLVMRWAF